MLLQHSHYKILEEKLVCSHGNGRILCTLTTPVCVRHRDIFGTSAGWHRTVTSAPWNPSVEREKKYIFGGGWRMSKNGNTASVFSAASVLNSLAYLWFCSNTVTHRREQRLAPVMGFNRKCGATSETGRGEERGAQKKLRRPLDADKPSSHPWQRSLRLQHNSINIAHPAGELKRDKSLRNVQRQIILARSEWMNTHSGL